jgi:hypothetical protein
MSLPRNHESSKSAKTKNFVFPFFRVFVIIEA